MPLCGTARFVMSHIPPDTTYVHEHSVRWSALRWGAFCAWLLLGPTIIFELSPLRASSPELKQIVFRECEFVKRACELTGEQQVELSKLDEKWIESVTRDAGTQRFANGFVRVLGIGPNADPALPRAKANALVSQLDRKFDELLNEQQKQRLAEERKLREDFRKEAMLEILLICLDRNIGLTAKQYEVLKSELKTWARSADLHPTSYLINQRFVPNYPITILRKHLTSSQMTILNSLQRIDFARSGGEMRGVVGVVEMPAVMIRN